MKALTLIAALVGLIVNVSVQAAHASTVTFVTPAGSTESGGNPVNASATFTTSDGQIAVTLTDLLANPTTVAQLISDLSLTLSTGQTIGTLASSSGTQINVAANGTFTLGATASTGWGLNNNVSGGLQLDALGFVGPALLIIGPPDAGGVYSAANNSIAGNGPHNPFIDGSATFLLDVLGVTADTTVTTATFSFGTTEGDNVPGVPGVPLPGALPLFGTGLVGLVLLGWRRKKAKIDQLRSEIDGLLQADGAHT
jgi:hypothetical protein